ncbi:hypothetical protein SERLA73DRAFT_77600 [Serpula lacrymans var. lacrymans S7.3]|uniref:Uncharacterized protein n=2 Tax=Serpula lacrymans var. lacrymans TaxID=341189 RepID=F8Q9W2_SERL3|nr:uncharacterized protein SERLADRAFT_442501 [Serpula lacrymans var. lacrymans S7.9]EGN94867.1 hypothetical protein SERLA73DRAFT_77600 [Serpula lacrymans var. lacrymans S7.3]EGO20365.1 hypothetical protein SERLADRAFT_442501 [Serpula lacrymans var. lacrymans S7.9]
MDQSPISFKDQGKHSVTVECSVHFDVENVSLNADNGPPFGLEGEYDALKQAPKKSQIVEIDDHTPHPDPPDPQDINNQIYPQDQDEADPDPIQAAPAPPPPPIAAPHQSTCIHQPTQYVHDLLQGKGSISGNNQAPTLPRGIQVTIDNLNRSDEEERDDETLRDLAQNIAMVARMADLHGVEPRTVEEARKRPDWDKWDQAIQEELARLNKAGTWTYAVTITHFRTFDFHSPL